jgi:hypothetical protein
LNLNCVSEIRQAEIHTTEQFVPEQSALVVELATRKLNNLKSKGINHIPAELIKAGSRKICCAIHRVIIAFWNKVGLREGWKKSIVEPIHKKENRRNN